MRNSKLAALIALLLAAAPGLAHAAVSSGFTMTVLVDGVARPEYARGETFYVEALRGRNYSLLLGNPGPRRVAVALSVDGLDTIDAAHVDAWLSSKWVIEPYGTVEIAGWQVDRATARRFLFTGERHSYGAALGQTADLGVIEAVFFVERPTSAMVVPEAPRRDRRGGTGNHAEPEARDEAAATPQRKSADAPATTGSMAPPSAPQLSPVDDYAATGMGAGTDHAVERVLLDLDPRPAARLRIRYEFRPQLVELGLLPPPPSPSALERRERAQGFAGFCPVPE